MLRDMSAKICFTHRAIVEPQLLALLDAVLTHEVVHVDLLSVLIPGRDAEDVRPVLGAGGVVDEGQGVAGEAPDDDELLRGVIPCTASCPSEGCPHLPRRPQALPRPAGHL